MRKIEPGKHQAGNGAVQEEVVPFNRSPDRASEDRAAKLPPMLCLVDRTGLVSGGHLVSLRRSRNWPPAETRFAGFAVLQYVS